MLKRVLVALAIAVILSSVLAAWVTVSRHSAAETSKSALSSARLLAAGERARRDQDIQFYEARAARDTISAGDRSALASLYLERGREAGDFSDVLHAEALARKSLQLREAHNAPTVMILASALLEQHRFRDALALAEGLLREEPASQANRAVVAEIRLELGDYDRAGKLFNTLKGGRTSLLVAPRLARWEEIRGRDNVARSLLEGARDSALKRTDLPRGQLAWFNVRLGEHYLRVGDTRKAVKALRSGLELAPDDPQALGAMARYEGTQGNWERVIELGERSIETSLDPGTVGLLADAYRATGNTQRAKEYDRVIDVAFLSNPGPFHRALSLYLLDQGRNVPLVLAKAQDEIRERRDVYGYDVLAWALFRSGRIPEARVAMTEALRMGTRDPVLMRHSTEIAAAASR